MTALRFPAEIAVGEVWWEDAREPGGWGRLLAIGVVEVPDRTAVRLSVHDVAEVTVSNRVGDWCAPAGTIQRLGRKAAASSTVRRPWTWSSSAACPRTASLTSA